MEQELKHQPPVEQIKGDTHYLWNFEGSVSQDDQREMVSSDKKSVGIVNSKDLEIHTLNPTLLKITGSNNIKVVIYSDIYSNDYPIPKEKDPQNLQTMKSGISETMCNNITYEYRLKSEFDTDGVKDDGNYMDGVTVYGDISGSNFTI